MSISYKKLRHILLDRDLKKKDLAKIAGVSTYTINKLNRNENVTVEVLAKICKALDCTMDDILEEIIGETTDEHDPKQETIKKIDEYTYEFDGMVNIEKVEEILNITFDETELSVTIGGRIFHLIGRLPIVGDVVEDKECTYKILELQNNRIKKILCTKRIEEDANEETRV